MLPLPVRQSDASATYFPNNPHILMDSRLNLFIQIYLNEHIVKLCYNNHFINIFVLSIYLEDSSEEKNTLSVFQVCSGEFEDNIS